MENFITWFDMNGYAAWVWSAYALWAVGFGWLVIGTRLGRKQALQRVAARRRRAGLQAAQSNSGGQA